MDTDIRISDVNGPQGMEEVGREGPDALGYKGQDKKKKKKVSWQILFNKLSVTLLDYCKIIL